MIPRAHTHRQARRCARPACSHEPPIGREFCCALCEHLHLRIIERTTPREVVETGELITGAAYLDGGTRRANLQNSA